MSDSQNNTRLGGEVDPMTTLGDEYEGDPAVQVGGVESKRRWNFDRVCQVLESDPESRTRKELSGFSWL